MEEFDLRDPVFSVTLQWSRWTVAWELHTDETASTLMKMKAYAWTIATLDQTPVRPEGDVGHPQLFKP